MKCDCFADEFKLISDMKLREVTIGFFKTCVPDYFYVVPASSSGKYHPAYALGPGGLVRHTKACVKIAECLLSLEQYETLNECYHDEIIIALLIHDTFKHGLRKEASSTKFEHPVYSAGAFQMFIDECYPNLSDRISIIPKVVMSHMGQWNRSAKSAVVLPKPTTDLEKFVHLCDYLASRQNITVDVTYEPQTEEQQTEET